MTPQDKAAAMAADSQSRFDTDPNNAVSHCTMQAAYHAERGRREMAVWWASVGAELMRLADNPYTQVGAVTGGILGGL
jgi:hypothetical protein